MPPPPHQRMRRCKAAIKPVCACCSLLASLPTMQPNYQHSRGCVTSQNFNYTRWSAADSERHSTRNGDSLLEKTNSLLKAPQGRKHDDTTIGWDRASGIWMQTESERCQHRTRQLTCLHIFYSASHTMSESGIFFSLRGYASYGWGGQVHGGLLERYDQAKSFDNFLRPYGDPYKAQKPVQRLDEHAQSMWFWD